MVNPKDLLVEMFEQMVVRKDVSLIERYYDPGFELHTNGAVQDYAQFTDGHRRVYATAISYTVEYDEQAWVVTDDRVAGRVWITTERPGEEPTKIEVVLIATCLDGRLYRLWELTWPDWSRLGALDEY